jgi:hypothetical protein
MLKDGRKASGHLFPLLWKVRTRQVHDSLRKILIHLALITMSRKAAYPKALLVPFRKGER